MDTEKLIEQLHKCFLKEQKILATAESCTGGKIAATITERAGSSVWFDRGFISYSNQSKTDLLSVKEQTLNKFGAVSEEVVREMVLGCLQKSKCDYSLSITGIAGPGGGTDDKPIGMVWFAWAKKHQPTVIKSRMKIFEGDRAAIRDQSVFFALSELLKFI